MSYSTRTCGKCGKEFDGYGYTVTIDGIKYIVPDGLCHECKTEFVSTIRNIFKKFNLKIIEW